MWSYKESQEKEIDFETIEYENTGDFYEDIMNVCGQAGITIHPSFKKPKPPTEIQQLPLNKDVLEHLEAEGNKEPLGNMDMQSLNIYSKRIDVNSLKALFYVLKDTKIICLRLNKLVFLITPLNIKIFHY